MSMTGLRASCSHAAFSTISRFGSSTPRPVRAPELVPRPAQTRLYLARSPAAPPPPASRSRGSRAGSLPPSRQNRQRNKRYCANPRSTEKKGAALNARPGDGPNRAVLDVRESAP